MNESLGLSWTAARIETLRRRWTNGVTSGDIAIELGVGRNAIMGKLRRMKLLGTRRDPEPMQIRCRLSGVGRELMFRRNLTKHKERLGTIVGVSRDGHCWIVVWDGMADSSRKAHPKYCVDFLEQEGAADAPVISKPNGDKGGSIVAKIKAKCSHKKQPAADKNAQRKASCSVMTSIKVKQKQLDGRAAPNLPLRANASLAEFNAGISKRQRVTLVRLTSRTCRLPLWPDFQRSGFYCGHRSADISEGRPFCAAHAQFAFSGKTSAKPWLPGRA